MTKRVQTSAWTIVATLSILLLSSPAVAETDCKSWFFGMCTSRYTPSEQAGINAQRRLEALLRDPTRAGPELEQRLRKQVHYSSGLLLIEAPVLHSTTTLPATIGWAIESK
jgi:hypothetical protein